MLLRSDEHARAHVQMKREPGLQELAALAGGNPFQDGSSFHGGGGGGSLVHECGRPSGSGANLLLRQYVDPPSLCEPQSPLLGGRRPALTRRSCGRWFWRRSM